MMMKKACDASAPPRGGWLSGQGDLSRVVLCTEDGGAAEELMNERQQRRRNVNPRGTIKPSNGEGKSSAAAGCFAAEAASP